MRVSRILLLLVALIAGGLAAYLATRGGREVPVDPARHRPLLKRPVPRSGRHGADRRRPAALRGQHGLAGLAGERCARRLH